MKETDYTSPMPLKRITQHIIIFVFLLITLLAFFVTMFHEEMPFTPLFLQPFVLFGYGMMAPYQGYERLNTDLFAEGLTANGQWQEINLDPYFPVLRGEKNIRETKLLFRDGSGADIVTAHARKIAERLLTVEHEHGHAFQSVKLSWEEWPPSPLGYDALRHSSSLPTEVLVTYP